jgi:hypothetical protein
MRGPVRSLVAFLASLIMVVACDQPVALTLESVSGNYTATSLTLLEVEDEVQETTNLLDAGITISMTLSPGGVTTGLMFVPATVTGTADENHDLAGTYSLSGNTVRFSNMSPTFIRDVAFTVQGSTLRGTRIAGTTTLSATLTRVAQP